MNVGLSILENVMMAGLGPKQPPNTSAKPRMGLFDDKEAVQTANAGEILEQPQQGTFPADQPLSANSSDAKKTDNIGPENNNAVINRALNQFKQIVRNQLKSDAPDESTIEALQATAQQMQLIIGQGGIDGINISQALAAAWDTNLQNNTGDIANPGESKIPIAEIVSSKGLLGKTIEQSQFVVAQIQQPIDTQTEQGITAEQTNQGKQPVGGQDLTNQTDKPSADIGKVIVNATVGQNNGQIDSARNASESKGQGVLDAMTLPAKQNTAGAEAVGADAKTALVNQEQQQGKVEEITRHPQRQSDSIVRSEPIETEVEISVMRFPQAQVAVAGKAGAAQIPAIQQFSVPVKNTNTRNTTADGNGMAGISARGVMMENSQPDVAQTTPAGASVAGNQSGEIASDVALSLREQIFQSIRSSMQNGNRQITINLHPPELGKVSIKLQEQAGKITGLLEVSSSQTRAEIQQTLPEIIRTLEQSGVQVKRLEVNLSDLQPSGQQQTFREQSPNELWADQQHWGQWSGQQGNNDAASGQYQPGEITSDQYQALSDLNASFAFGEVSINILA